MAETLSTGEYQYWPIYGTNTTERNSTYASLLRLLRSHSPTSSHLFGFLALFISGGLLTFLLGVSLTATAVGFIAFLPLIIISGPIWLPGFVLIGGCLTVAVFLVGAVAVLSWMYRYYRGMHPTGSDQIDYARGRIYDTALHVKDYARYFNGRAKDTAPGA